MPNATLLELAIRILCDNHPSSPADGAFLFGQTPDNQESVLTAASQLLSTRCIHKILFVQTVAMSGFPGFEAWKQELVGRGVNSQQIEGVTGVNTLILHTLIEAEAMARFAREKGYRSLYIVSPPFHQVRAFMTAVTATLREYPELQLYSYPGVVQPWQESVLHSQGQTQGTRSQLIYGELERISKYNQKGDLASVAEVLEYLNKR